jgi:hypothetical protein
MRQALWQRIIFWPRSWWNHYVLRVCTCHKMPWQDWEEPE